MIKKIIRVLLFIYVATLVWILVFKFGIWTYAAGNTRRINLIPYHAPVILNGKTDTGELILNILIFVPLGLYIGALFRQWSTAKKILAFFLVSFFIEVVQFILIIGAFDITDIINNMLGGVLGLIFVRVISLIAKNPVKADKFIAITSAIGTILFFALMLYVRFSNRFIFQ